MEFVLIRGVVVLLRRLRWLGRRVDQDRGSTPLAVRGADLEHLVEAFAGQGLVADEDDGPAARP